MTTRISDDDRVLARVLLDAQSNGYGVVAENGITEIKLRTWESLGWTECSVDSDGDRQYILTFAGADALLGAHAAAKA